MIQHFRFVAIFALGASLLISCQSYVYLNDPALKAPVQDTSMAEVASVTLPSPRTVRAELIVTLLDGDNIEDYETASGMYQFPPGNRRLGVEYRSVGQRSEGRDYFASGALLLDLKPGKRYVPTCTLTGIRRDRVKIWFIDPISGEVVSDYLDIELYERDRRL